MNHETSAEFLSQHGQALQALARRLVRDASEADDAVQETWLAYLRRPPQQREGESIGGWLATVLGRVVSKRARSEGARRGREGTVAVPDRIDTDEATLERKALLREVVDSVFDLSEPYQTTIFLRYFEGLPPREIARRQGVTNATVRSRLHRGLGMLRERLDRENEQWGAGLAPLAFAGGAARGFDGYFGWKGLWMATNVKLAGTVVVLVAAVLWLASTRTGNEAPLEPRETTRTAALEFPTRAETVLSSGTEGADHAASSAQPVEQIALPPVLEETRETEADSAGEDSAAAESSETLQPDSILPLGVPGRIERTFVEDTKLRSKDFRAFVDREPIPAKLKVSTNMMREIRVTDDRRGAEGFDGLIRRFESMRARGKLRWNGGGVGMIEGESISVKYEGTSPLERGTVTFEQLLESDRPTARLTRPRRLDSELDLARLDPDMRLLMLAPAMDAREGASFKPDATQLAALFRPGGDLGMIYEVKGAEGASAINLPIAGDFALTLADCASEVSGDISCRLVKDRLTHSGNVVQDIEVEFGLRSRRDLVEMVRAQMEESAGETTFETTIDRADIVHEWQGAGEYTWDVSAGCVTKLTFDGDCVITLTTEVKIEDPSSGMDMTMKTELELEGSTRLGLSTRLLH